MKNKIIHIYNIYIIIFKFNFGPMDMPHKAQQNNNIIIRSYETDFFGVYIPSKEFTTEQGDFFDHTKNTCFGGVHQCFFLR